MKKTVFHIDIDYNHQLKSFTLSEGTLSIGNTEKSDYLIPDEKHEEKILLQIQDNDLLVKINNPSFAIESAGKLYRSVRVKKSSTVHCGLITIKVEARSIEYEEEEELVLGQDNSESLPHSFSDQKMLFSKVPTISETVQSGSTTDFNTFNIFFDETGKLTYSIPYENDEFTFDNYIELSDKKPSPEDKLFTKSVKGQAIHIVHTHNGTTLNDQYYPLTMRDVFIGNSGKSKKRFTVHDSDTRESRLVSIRDEKIHILKQNGYEFLSVDSLNKLSPIQYSSTLLKEGNKVILGKGLSQIFIEIKKMPPALKKDHWPSFDDKVLKCLLGSWAALFIPLILILMLTETPVANKVFPETEIAVIFKRPEPKREKLPEPEQKATLTETNAPKEPEEVIQKVVESAPPKKELAAPTQIPPKQKPDSPLMPETKQADAAPVKSIKKDIKATEQTYTFTALAEISKSAGRINGSVGAITNTANVKLDHLMAGNDTSISQSDSNLVSTGSISNRIIASNNSGTEGSGTKGTSGLSQKGTAMTSYRAGDVRVLGSIDPELIKKILREYIPQFRYCYQKELMHNPSIAGVFDLNFTINNAGKGQDVFLKQSKGEFTEKTVECIGKVVAMISFPVPKGGSTVEVRQPMNFSNE